MRYLEERKQLAKVGKFMVVKKLTNNAGGNISMLVDSDEKFNYFILSPKQAGQVKYWNLLDEDVMVIRQDKSSFEIEKIEGTGELTRETSMHLNVYKGNENIKSVIHAHPYESMGFVTFGNEIPLVCENVMKLKRVPVLPFAPATTPELAQVVGQYVKNDEYASTQGTIAFGLRGHGVVVGTNSDLNTTLDILERLEYNSKAINDYSVYQSNKDSLQFPKYEVVGDE